MDYRANLCSYIWTAGDSNATMGAQRKSSPGDLAAAVRSGLCVWGGLPWPGQIGALVMPKANSEGMQQHLDVIAAAVTPGKHAVLVVDRAAWHVTAKLQVPANLSILPLPPYSPELNPVEQIGQQLRQSDCANRCFKNYDDIVEVYCQAWNRFTKQSDIIRTLCSRKWAVIA